jgi:cytochrome c oxidase accessory protein FixG
MSTSSDNNSESFRDSIATINEEGKRNWIYPKRPQGKYYRMRLWVSAILLALLFIGPYLRIAGQPLLLLNVLERKFVIFGLVFWPQDFHLFLLAMITFVVFIVLFTVVLGRIWCGWACPQTIFMEMVFRRIEYVIEGDAGQQKRLNKMPWVWEKIWKKGLKATLFFIFSFAIANTFLAYIIGSEQLIEIITDDPRNHVQGLTSILLFTGVFYFVFAWFREQVCIVVCPYGRLQGVLLDRNSIIVAYNYLRGEKRAKFRKNEDRATTDKGDCVDCGQCVAVCPTGIDIRNGTQLECVNCTACMDACDNMMEKVGLEKGLIAYNSEENIANNESKLFTTRVKAYIGVLLFLLSLLIFLLSSRTKVETVLLRAPGQLYQEQVEGKISNLYTFEIVNKSMKEQEIDFRLEDRKGELQLIGLQVMKVEKQDILKGSMFILLKEEDLTSVKTNLEIGVYSEGEQIDLVETNFIGPNKN